ncbi:conjugal transfer protein [Methylomonas sp. Kb3]|uniref:IncP plasmid survival protein KfrC family protein n=1 Tax=Methylomonas sp. Kb3 TaxID=1611544 RepID=UPI000C31DF7D|nr:IncP plasmid survival protein KfrC family protein [Methylomonas sp. Kb3]PKD40494.1 conjugal transfer protein [Methylomonas sp. Kb3]
MALDEFKVRNDKSPSPLSNRGSYPVYDNIISDVSTPLLVADELVESAQEAEREQQAYLEVTSVEQSFQEALIVYVYAKHEQVDRVEDKLENLIEKQQSRLQQYQATKPGLLSLPGARRAWQDQQAQQQSRLLAMQAKLETVREIRDGMGLHSPKIEELAERKLRKHQPEMAQEFDNALEVQRRHSIVTRMKQRHIESIGIGSPLTLSISQTR